MTRSSRTKSHSKTKDTEDTSMNSNEHQNFNGVVADIIDPSLNCSISTDLPKKRNALASSSSDLGQGNVGPPQKKRHVNELSTNRNKAQKRCNDTALDKKSLKLPRLEDTTNRIWTKISDMQSLNSNSDYVVTDRNFIMVSYNIAPVSELFYNKSADCNLHHKILLDELSFINADIICLQHVGNVYWEVLEKSLKECGYRGNVIFDNDESIGLATFYRTNRFTQKSIENGKLSDLCLKIIPHNNGLDESTMSTIKQYLEESESYIISVFEDRKHNRLLIVGNTRLSDNRSDKPDLKCVQAVGLFWRIYDKICHIKADSMNNNGVNIDGSSPSWILCGDFNGAVDSPVYQICRDGYPNESSIEQLQAMNTLVAGSNTHSLVNLIWHSFQHPLIDSTNSYNNWTCKTKNDYIWMSKTHLKTEGVLLPRLDCGQESVTDGIGGGIVTNGSLVPLSLACHLVFMT